MIQQQQKEAPKQYQQRKTRQTRPVVIEIEKESDTMTVEVDNPYEDVDIQIVSQKKGTPNKNGVRDQAIRFHFYLAIHSVSGKPQSGVHTRGTWPW